MNEVFFDICIAALVVAVFKLLVPNNKNSSQIKMIIACFFILSVIDTLKGNISITLIQDMLKTDVKYNDYTDVLTQQTADEIANSLRERITESLEKEKLTAEKIYIDVNISNNSSISINEIKLVFKDTESTEAKRAVMIVKECTGNEIKVSLEAIN